MQPTLWKVFPNIEIKARSGGGLHDYVMKSNVRSKDFGPNKECWHYKATLRLYRTCVRIKQINNSYLLLQCAIAGLLMRPMVVKNEESPSN